MMAADRSYVERNAASAARLAATVARIGPLDLAKPTEESGWTVCQTLGHMAFWDRFLASRWRAAGQATASGGAEPAVTPDWLADVLNAGLAPLLGALAPSAGPAVLAAAVLEAARDVDSLVAGLPADTPVAKILAERPGLLDRSMHRTQHLDQIQRALGGSTVDS